MKKLYVATQFLPLLLLTACPGTRTGNPDDVKVPLVMRATETQTVAQNSWFENMLDRLVPSAVAFGTLVAIDDSVGNEVEMSDAIVGLAEIELKANETAEEAEEEEVALPGPYFVDLLATTPQVLDEISVSATGYRRIKMKLRKPEDSDVGVPSELGNNAIYLAGTINGSVNFTFQTEEETEFEISGSNAVTPSSSADLLAVIRLGDMIKAINLTNLISAGNKNISDANRISATDPCPSIHSGASDLFTCFRDGLEVMSEFGKDSDGSGNLEDDEDSSDD